MLLKDKLQKMSKGQLSKQIKSYQEQIDIQKSMSESAKANHLFGSSIESNLELAKKELVSRE